MIEKIEILHHHESGHLSGHFCEEIFRFLCIVEYHYEMVVQRGEKTSRIYAENGFATITPESDCLAGLFTKEFRILAALIILPMHYQIVNNSRTLFVQPNEQIVLANNAKGFRREGKSHYFQIEQCRDDSAASYVSFLLYSISCELLVEFKDFSELCNENDIYT